MARKELVLIVMAFVLALSPLAAAEPQLTLGTVAVEQGGTASLEVGLADGTENYGGINATILLPEGVTVTGVTEGPLLGAGGFEVQYRNFAGATEQGVSVVAYSGATAFNALSGVVLLLDMTVTGRTAPGVQSADFASPDGNALLNSEHALSNSNGTSSVGHLTSAGTITVLEGTHSDGDDMPDAWEALYPLCLDPFENDADGDCDGDGLTNYEEFLYGGDPTNPDTDGDGMPDGWEALYDPCLNLLVNDADADCDGDGYSNYEEYLGGSDPTDPMSIPLSTIYVDDDNVSGPWDGTYEHPYLTIGDAFDVAFGGTTIVVREGLYNGPDNKNLDFGGRAITVQSEDGPMHCLIDCEGDGRAFYLNSGETSVSVIAGFTITNGSVTGHGGGIYCGYGCSPTITNCIITGNSASGLGGGIFFGDESLSSMTNCLIVGNDALNGGGIYCWNYAAPSVTNCTFSGNDATFGGAACFHTNSSTTLTNCVLWGDFPNEIGGTATVTYSDVQGSCPGTGNIDADPLFLDPGYWTGTDWVDGDYHLYPCSPAIDAGDPASDYSNEPEPHGDRANMGAYGNTCEAACLSFDTSALVTLPDISGNGVSEIAVPSVNWTTGKVVVLVKDLSSGLLSKAVWFSSAYKPLALEEAPDLNANGSSELALLGIDPATGKVMVQVKDSSTGLLVRNIWYSSVFTPLALRPVPDINANGYAELAVMAIDWVTGKVVMEIKDSFSGLLVKNVYFSNMFTPLAFEVLPDINANGSPELAVLSTDWSTGKVVVQVKDSSTGLLVKNVYFSTVFEPMAIEVAPDINANGSPELAVLSMNRGTGKVVVQIKDSFTGLLVKNVYFSDVFEPLAMEMVDDLNANGSSELGLLSVNHDTAKVVVQVKDSSTGLLIKNVWLSTALAPLALQATPDLNANGSCELAVLSVDSCGGKVVVQVKDPFTGLLVKNIWF